MPPHIGPAGVARIRDRSPRRPSWPPRLAGNVPRSQPIRAEHRPPEEEGRRRGGTTTCRVSDGVDIYPSTLARFAATEGAYFASSKSTASR